MSIATVLRVAAVVLAVAMPAHGARAETLSGSNVDSRVLVALDAPAAAVEDLLPEGHAPVAFPGGPLQGANLLVVLIDGLLEMDAEGRPLSPPTRRAAVLVGLGQQEDEDSPRLFVLRSLTTVPGRDPYGVNVPADIDRTTTLAGPEGARRTMDAWRIRPEGGGELAITLDFAQGARGWGPGDAFPHSAADPEFSRIYRYEQLVDVVGSAALGKPLDDAVTLSSTVPDLAPIFDGAPQIVAVLDVPVYVRQVFLP